MSTGKPKPLGPSNFMEALDTGTWEKNGVLVAVAKDGGERGIDEEREMEAVSYTSSSSTEESEETDEDSEPEPPPVVRRKVSFADAFGLNLVSVKEFDNADMTETEHSNLKTEIKDYCEEYYLSCLFSVPSTPEELSQRLQDQKLELESIQLFPHSTVLRGIVRVLNLCFDKSVYARISLDGWKSHFDLLAEYMPGSSDRETDCFTFRLTLVPSFDRDGTKVEFCLRYETSVGTFWANNRDLNYVLFCRQKVKEVVREQEKEQKESSNHKGKLSCLKANRKNNTDERAIGITSTTINIGVL
ncbi:protein phosphatase 1 regulatory subunit 3A-like [Aplochiton taeniatus]